MTQPSSIDGWRTGEIAVALLFLCLFIPSFVWACLSAVASFAALEWVSITASPIGRLAFLLTLIWEWRVGIKTVKDTVKHYRARVR